MGERRRGSVAVRTLRADALLAAIPALAELRIAVFRAFPYLYDGDPAYERDYLREFAAAPGSVLVAALDGERIVGAATASPMPAQKAAFRAPFAAAGIDCERLFYFGESVLLGEWRGQGVGHAFFDAREATARAWGADAAAFAAVVRAPDDPRRPAGYRPLDGFWRARGYAPVPGLTTRLAWKELGEAGEGEKPMQCWLRRW